MRQLFLMFLFTCSVATVYAQKSTKDSNYVAKKNELLLEVPATPTQLSTPSGLMYRRNFKKASLRIRLTGTYRDSYSTNNLITNTQYSFSSAVGIQKNVPITTIFQFYWGGDLSYGQNVHLLKDSVNNRRNTSNTVGLLPFVGFKFTFRKRFIMGVENAGVFNFVNTVSVADRDDGTYSTHIASHSNAFNFSYSKNARFYFGMNF
jgi:hypothetical protein